jgi:hypothetical protein
MKILDPDTQTITPQAQMWLGVIGSLTALLGGILVVTEPMATLDQLTAFSMFSSVLFVAWTARRGYQRLSKTGNLPANSETFAAKVHPTGE